MNNWFLTDFPMWKLAHEPGSAAVPAASSSGVSPHGDTRGATPLKPAGEDACATSTAAGLRGRSKYLAARFAGILLAVYVAAASAPQAQEGFRPIFDGRSLTGWETPDRSY